MVPVSLWALVSAVVYGAIGIVVGDTFLFSNYQLYSSATKRREGAVPTFLVEGVEGVEARMLDWVGYLGIEPAQIHWYEYPCSLQWMVEEARRWVAEYPAESGAEADPQRREVSCGMRVFTVADDGSISERVDILVRGSAVPG